MRDAALVWFGSIFHSLLVFLPGNVLGPHEVKLSYLLNVPYILVPLYVLHRMLASDRQKVYLEERKVRADGAGSVPQVLNLSLQGGSHGAK